MVNKKTLEAALDYASRGWHVFPIHSIVDGKCTCGNSDCSDAGKHPAVSRGVKEASTDISKIEAWFSTDERRNIGIATGERSNITIIDIDTADGKGGAESWAEAIQDHGEPDTLMAETGSGGMHVIFKYNSALKTSSNTLGKGVDCRNDGGYIVAAPSLHRSGGQYKWMNWGNKIANLPAHLSKRKDGRGRPKKDDMYKSKYSLEQVAGMLEFIPADDRDFWRSVGIILGREFKRVDEAWHLYVEWADKEGGTKGRNHDAIMHEAFYELSQQTAHKELSLGSIVKAAIDNGWAPKAGEVPLGHFVYYAPGNNFIYRPTISYWIAAAVDAAVSPVNEDGQIMPASEWLKRNQLATSLTCDPSIEDDYIKGVDCRKGEVVKTTGAAMYNSYRKPTLELGDAKLAHPFVDHVKKVFNKKGDADQFLDYMAHRVQRPWEKPRFALLIAGGQGVGKDTAIEFCIPAIGAWNVANIDPSALQSNFNEFSASALVRINETANLQEMSKWAFGERIKVLIAGSPDYCEVNPKYGQKFSIRMFCGVILTTNHMLSGIYISKDDRRFDVVSSATLDEMGLAEEQKRTQYFSDLWEWFYSGGDSHVAAYLTERDLSNFSHSSGQRKTEAHKLIVNEGRERFVFFRDILEELSYPRFLSFPQIKAIASKNGEDVSNIGKFTTKLKPALEDEEYAKYNNPDVSDGRWKKPNCGKSFVVYAKSGTPLNIDPRPEVKAESEMF